jgi:hypothetical protein
VAWTACLALLACGGGGGGGGGPAFVSSGPCDAGIVVNDADPVIAARVIGICDGLVDASWIYPDGSSPTLDTAFHLGHGITDDFGPNNPGPEGANLLVLSSGNARRPSDPGFSAAVDRVYTTGFPAGYPQEHPSCPGVVMATPHDGIGLRVVLDVPDGVIGYAFDYAYFSRDYPSFLCSQFGDGAAAVVFRTGFGPTNVLLDSSGGPMVATGNFQACTGCPQGTAPLTNTGYEMNGGSGWLTTGTLPALPSDTITIEFSIWDSGDGAQDSTLIVDNFRWIPAP